MTVATDFTPATFTLDGGEEYRIGVADYLAYVFDHWLDSGSTDRWRPVAIAEDTELVAVYRIQAADGPEQTAPAGASVDEEESEEAGAESSAAIGGGNANVYARFYGPIAEAIAAYDLSEIPEADRPLNYLQDCVTYVGFVHMRGLVEHELNIQQQAWLYAQIKPQLDEHFTRIC